MNFDSDTLVIKGFALKQTCNACPEQYDVYKGGRKVGYFRLRHGSFSADNVLTDEEVYRARPAGDGCFEDGERQHYLENAVQALRDSLILRGEA